MAVLVTSASISPVATAAAEVDVVHFRYAKALSDLLPPGRAFTRREGTALAKLLRALAMEFSRGQRRLRRFLADCDPSTSLAALEWWEILLGLPDCEVPTTIEGRRIAAAAKLAAAAGHDQSVPFWAGLFAGLGYDFTTFKFSEWMMTCEDECTDPLIDESWMLFLLFIVEHGEQDGLLECRVEAEQLLGMKFGVHYKWGPVDVGEGSETIYGLASNSNGATVAVGVGGLVLTSDWMLEEWAEQTPPTGDALYAVAAVDEVLVAVGESVGFYRSTDNGVTWAFVAYGSEEKYSVTRGPLDDAVVLAVGDAGSIYRSADAGLTWSTPATPTAQTLEGVSAVDGAAIAVGTNGTILRTNNNGALWTIVVSPTAQHLRAVDGRGPLVVAVGDNGTFVVSDDAGLTWTVIPPVTALHLHAVSGSPGGRWVAVGDDATILATEDPLGAWAPQFTTATADLLAATESTPLGFLCLAGANRAIIVE